MLASMPITEGRTASVHELAGTRFTPLASPSRGSTEICVWRVELPPHADAVPHELTREEVLVVLSGSARASIDGRVADVAAGDAIIVPPHTPFCLTAVGDEPVVALAYLPVGGQARMPGREPFTPPWAQ
jgi:mannose-6-phosphate isomerase-like protein (cupin superfamily)